MRNLNIHTIVSMPFSENTYVVWLPDHSEALVVDPGLEPKLILDFLQDQGLTVAAILNTHGHVDHIAGNADLKRAFLEAPIVIGVNDAVMLTDPFANLSALCELSITSPSADRLIREGEIVESAGIQLEVLDVPGHSPGHVAYLYRGAPMLVFGGDVLFRGGIGRYDLPGGDGQTLLSSIRDKFLPLPPETVVYPGHGPVTTIGQESRHNPFLEPGDA